MDLLTDPRLHEIVALSLTVSLLATLAAAVVGMPLGAWLGVARFRGRRALVVLLDAFMGLPPVVVGLVLYLLFSRAGPLGQAGLLYTPALMVIAQGLLVLPILAALTRGRAEDQWALYGEQLRSMGASRKRAVGTLLLDDRYGLLSVLLAGFGRAMAEVGAVLMVGGNIEHHTRVMTTTIAMETSKGDMSLALALGAVLMTLAILVSLLAHVLGAAEQRLTGRREGA